MTDNFLNEIMKTATAVLCQSMGWNSAQTTAIDILSDVWKRQFLQIGKAAHRNAEHCGRTQVGLEDAMLAFNDMGISTVELEEYIHNFDPVPLPYKVPNFPVPKENHLNFLRPGSAEVLTRPVHIHEYMPPWTIPTNEEKEKKDQAKVVPVPDSVEPKVELAATPALTSSSLPSLEKEEDETALTIVDAEVSTVDKEKEILENGSSDSEKDSKVKEGDVVIKEEPGSPQPGGSASNSFGSTPPKSAKRMESPGESPALKRVRMMLEEEGHSLRQISSVMMTTSGFLTSSREGRLPDTRPPSNRDFFEVIPAPPPEKKKKIPTMKKIVEGVKKIDKERDSEKPFDLFEKPDRIITLPREDGLSIKEGKKDSSRRDKESKKKLSSSSSKRDKDGSRKDRQKLEARRKDKKFSKQPDKELREKLNIFKKNMILKKSEKLAKKARKLKIKREREEEEELDDISSDEIFDDEDVKPDISSKKEISIKKLKTKEVSPLTVPIPKTSPKFRDLPLNILAAAAAASCVPGSSEPIPKKKRGRPRKFPPNPLQNLAAGITPLNMAKMAKRLQQTFGRDVSALIPEITIAKPPPPPVDFPMMIGRLPMQPGLIPTSFAPPPAMRNAQNIPPSINITPATPTISGNLSPQMGKDRGSPSLNLPPNVCSSVTITRIDMSHSQKLPTPYDNSSTPGIGPQSQMSISISPQGQRTPSSSNSSSNLTIQADANSGITITPIVMDKGSRGGSVDMTPQPGEKIKSGKVSGLAKLEEDFRTKDQRKKDRERRKELRKEKKKERREKERLKSIKLEKGEKKERKDKDKEKKKKSDTTGLAPEGFVPKLTLKLHSNTNTPVDSPNPPQRMMDDRMDTPPPRKITIKPVEEFVGKRDSSPELARFSPLVTRPPKSNKVSLSTRSPSIPHSANSSHNESVSFPPHAPGSKRGPGRPPKSGSGGGGSSSGGGGSGRGPGRPPKSSSSATTSQAGLVTETVGFYIDDQGTKVWICPSCGRQDDGSPMIGCDTCDDWYHFTCVGIKDTPDETEQWFCKRCISNQKRKHGSSSSSSFSEHRKKGPKL